ncbi:ASCH domain-containing protein [Filobacillus milosensis]|uniref:ASCH domain-containing protein n=1 Tax=Filobacillus milosensis TaxID=94137 RepID=A0A4Y8IJ56_9BACI|nr:ASCH domain-containing protein [Filobacillus milosensis]TFB19626.1 ASCH domain-containing protein [Filobacillus milosensis]
MNEQSVKTMWQNFLQTLVPKEAAKANYEAWPFGDGPELADELATLVKAGEKTATCSLYQFYIDDSENIPKVGEYNIITDWYGQAILITQTKKVDIVPFNEVSAEFAFKEGEGDKSYEYWRREHIKFFNRELAESNRSFDENMLVVCEEFEVVFE